MAKRYSDVEFEFVSGAYFTRAYRGTVIVRDGEMVLEIEKDDTPYLIRGRPHRGFFRGRDIPVVEAKWILLDDMFIGTWLEDRIDYFFTFRLPKKDEHPRRAAK